MTKWPPRDPVIRVLSDVLDASPHSDWLTSGQRVLAAERLVGELFRAGYVIRPVTPLPPAAPSKGERE